MQADALASVAQAIQDADALSHGEGGGLTSALEVVAVDLDHEVQKRRCFAIIAVRDCGDLGAVEAAGLAACVRHTVLVSVLCGTDAPTGPAP